MNQPAKRPNTPRSMLRIALVHDWLTGMRGGEKCLEVLCRLWPDAHLYTLIHRPGRLSPAIERMDIRTSFLQNVPGIFENYRHFLPVMPTAIESFRLRHYDLVFSLSHCVAKSIVVPLEVPHICYCFTPMRYAWHMREAYWAETRKRAARGQQKNPGGKRLLALRPLLSALRSLLLADMRRWDRKTAERVTHFIAISRTVEQRIRECYGRDSAVICPPVDVQFYTPSSLAREDFYLCVSAFSPYKRLDLAIEACNRLDKKLVVIGTGPEETRLRTLAGPRVSFLGWQSDEVIREHYRRCRALLFPGEEEFGIVPIEAQACGAPVIAFGSGGATETVLPATSRQPGTGLLFSDQSPDCLADAIKRLESGTYSFPVMLAQTNAGKYSVNRFAAEIESYVRAVIEARESVPMREGNGLAAA